MQKRTNSDNLELPLIYEKYKLIEIVAAHDMVRVSQNYDNLAYVGAVRRFGNNFAVTIYGIASIFEKVLRFLSVSSTFQKF